MRKISIKSGKDSGNAVMRNAAMAKTEMGFEQPEGRIVINTGVGRCDHVNPEKVISYGFAEGDRVYQYDTEDDYVRVNLYRETIDRLSKVEF